MSRHRWSAVPFVALLAVSIALVACGDDDPASDEAAADRSAAKTCADVDLASPPSEPTNIRFGDGQALGEPFWLMLEKPDLGKYSGKWYDIERKEFRGGEDRFVAYQAGELDAVLTGGPSQVDGDQAGLDIISVATMIDLAPDGFAPVIASKKGSGIDTVADLKGKRIAINDLNTIPHLSVQAAVTKAGLDPDDVEFVILPFPAILDALSGGQVDAAYLVEPFYTLAKSQDAITEIYDDLDAFQFSFPLIQIGFRGSFIDEHLGAVCAFLADYASTMDWYKAHTDEGRKIVYKGGYIPIPLDAYLKTQDVSRPAGGKLSVKGLQRLFDFMAKYELTDESPPAEKFVRKGVSLVE